MTRRLLRSHCCCLLLTPEVNPWSANTPCPVCRGPHIPAPMDTAGMARTTMPTASTMRLCLPCRLLFGGRFRDQSPAPSITTVCLTIWRWVPTSSTIRLQRTMTRTEYRVIITSTTTTIIIELGAAYGYRRRLFETYTHLTFSKVLPAKRESANSQLLLGARD